MTESTDNFDPTTASLAPPQIPVRAEWLARARDEPVIEPALPIIDPHHHLWHRPGQRYLVNDLLADLQAGHDVRATVFVQCRSHYRADGPEALRPVGETEFVVRATQHLLPGQPRVAAGIVCMADLMLGDAVAPVLDAQIAAGQRRLRGVRTMTSSHPAVASMFGRMPEHRLLDPQWRKGASHLAARGLLCEVYVFHTQLGEVEDLARSMPDTTIVLNHLGTPLNSGPFEGRGEQVLAEWRAALAGVARCPNVVLKLGGAGIHVIGFRFHEQPSPPDSQTLADALRPYVETGIALFGAERCMFESNFPVDKGQFGYRALWNAFKRLCAGASADEKAQLFYRTAARVYRIDL
jgi:predicted TIM-barrel fold metal-dependent hydrolase